MPQIDVKYSNDVDIDLESLFSTIAVSIADLDQHSGECKCRAYPTNTFQTSNVLINISLLKKPHRDEGFMNRLLERLNENCPEFIASKCAFSIQIKFLSPYYSVANL